MRASLALLLPLLGALVLLPGCATSSETTAVPAGIDTTDDLVAYLSGRGYVLRPAGVTVPLVLSVPGQVYRIQSSRARIAIYEFDSAQAAERGADAFQLDTLGGGQAALYQHGPLLVASTGGDSSLELTLTQALGAGGY